MAKPKSTVRKGVRVTTTKDGTRNVNIITTKKGKGLTDRVLKRLGK